MLNLQKREKFLLGIAGVTVVFFVVDQLLCEKEAQQAPETAKKSIVEKSIPEQSEIKEVKNKRKIKPIRKRESGKIIEYTSWGRDPFAEAIRLAESDTTMSDSSDFVLRGIIWKGKEAHVLIGDDILKEGERKGDLIVLDIEKSRVVCKKGGKIVTLVLKEDDIF
ncbi:MAG: hypothetical protein ACE5JB_15770 [bacterium]